MLGSADCERYYVWDERQDRWAEVKMQQLTPGDVIRIRYRDGSYMKGTFRVVDKATLNKVPCENPQEIEKERDNVIPLPPRS